MCDRRISVTRLVEWLCSRKPTSFDSLILLRPLRSEATLEKRNIAPPKESQHAWCAWCAILNSCSRAPPPMTRAACRVVQLCSRRWAVYGTAGVSFSFHISIIYDYFICKTESLPYVPLNMVSIPLSKGVVHVCTLPLDCSLILNLK